MEESAALPTTGLILWLPPHPKEERIRAGEKESHHLFASASDKKGLQEFLGAAGFCRIWIPGFSAIAKPLYDLLGSPDREPPAKNEEAEATFTEMEPALGQAPALGLPDTEKPFHLFVHKKEKIALRALT